MAELQPVSPEAILAAKAKYGENRLKLIGIEVDGKDIDYLLRKPGRSVIEAVARHKGDITAANKVLLTNCVLAGDADALDQDGDVYAQVLKHISGMMRGAKSTVKKL